MRCFYNVLARSFAALSSQRRRDPFISVKHSPRLFRLAFCCLATIAAAAWAQQPQSAQTASGTVTGVDAAGSRLTLKTDAGQEIKVALQPRTSFRRVAPGATDLTKAEPIELGQIKTGDRVLARGQIENQTVAATLIVVMTQGDIAKKQQADQADWTARGVTGLVTSVGPDSVTINVRTLAGVKPMTLTPAPNAIIRRYAPDSVSFQDAKPSSLAELKPGDQVRARGNKSADNSKMSAEEIVSGNFRTVAGVILSINAAASELQIRDLDAKKPLVVKLVADSSVKKIQPALAQRIAVQLHGDAAPGRGRGGSAQGRDAAPQDDSPLSRRAGDFGGSAAAFRGGNADIQTILDNSPNITIADLKVGDAIVVSSTVGATAGKITAIKLLAGVEPILTKPGTQEMTLGSWDLGGAFGGGGGGGQ
ncbi:MAG TPA: DUF5666 domain-containing protein [Bryobacteraceae bacterium]|nr:DUF5666 domain-containing protein [Bryobacteraceae bacterium]